MTLGTLSAAPIAFFVWHRSDSHDLSLNDPMLVCA
jgi:hypothetical protein